MRWQLAAALGAFATTMLTTSGNVVWAVVAALLAWIMVGA